MSEQRKPAAPAPAASVAVALSEYANMYRVSAAGLTTGVTPMYSAGQTLTPLQAAVFSQWYLTAARNAAETALTTGVQKDLPPAAKQEWFDRYMQGGYQLRQPRGLSESVLDIAVDRTLCAAAIQKGKVRDATNWKVIRAQYESTAEKILHEPGLAPKYLNHLRALCETIVSENVPKRTRTRRDQVDSDDLLEV